MSIIYRDGFTKISAGRYYIRRGDKYADVRKESAARGQWSVTIKSYQTHQVVRYAGVWQTLADAKVEAKAVLEAA